MAYISTTSTTIISRCVIFTVYCDAFKYTHKHTCFLMYYINSLITLKMPFWEISTMCESCARGAFEKFEFWLFPQEVQCKINKQINKKKEEKVVVVIHCLQHNYVSHNVTLTSSISLRVFQPPQYTGLKRILDQKYILILYYIHSVIADCRPWLHLSQGNELNYNGDIRVQVSDSFILHLA